MAVATGGGTVDKKDVDKPALGTGWSLVPPAEDWAGCCQESTRRSLGKKAIGPGSPREPSNNGSGESDALQLCGRLCREAESVGVVANELMSPKVPVEPRSTEPESVD